MVVTPETVRRLALTSQAQADLRRATPDDDGSQLSPRLGLRTRISLRTRRLCTPRDGVDVLTELGEAVRRYLIRQERNQ